jgi:hypothetical protein
MTLLALTLAYAGFTALALAMHRHHEEVFGSRRIPALRRRGLRVAGWALLAASFPAAVAGWGWTMGPVLWCGLLTAAAAPLVLLLPVAPRLAAGLATAAPVVALLGVIAGRA